MGVLCSGGFAGDNVVWILFITAKWSVIMFVDVRAISKAQAFRALDHAGQVLCFLPLPSHAYAL